MSKIAFVFPGQGAQYTGMAHDFYERFPVSREVFEKASRASGLDVAALCFGHKKCQQQSWRSSSPDSNGRHCKYEKHI